MKLSRFVMLSLVAPVALAAQQPPAGLPPNPSRPRFATGSPDCIATLRRRSTRFPNRSSLTSRRRRSSLSATSRSTSRTTITSSATTLARMKGTRAVEDTATADSVKATWPKDKLVAQLKQSFAFCDQAIAQLDDAKLGEPVTITFGGNSRTVVSRAAMVARPRARPGGPLQPARELHASEQHASADGAPAAASGRKLAHLTDHML